MDDATSTTGAQSAEVQSGETCAQSIRETGKSVQPDILTMQHKHENVEDLLGDVGVVEDCKIFVGGLPWQTTTEDLTRHFAKYGEITDAVVVKDRATGRSRGFGFVTFLEQYSSDEALHQPQIIQGRMVEVKLPVPRDAALRMQQARAIQSPRLRKLFVGGLPNHIAEDVIVLHFARFGRVLEAQVLRDRETQRSRGFAFITFETEQAAARALLAGSVQEIGGKGVEVKKAEPRRSVSLPRRQTSDFLGRLSPTHKLAEVYGQTVSPPGYSIPQPYVAGQPGLHAPVEIQAGSERCLSANTFLQGSYGVQVGMYDTGQGLVPMAYWPAAPMMLGSSYTLPPTCSGPPQPQMGFYNHGEDASPTGPLDVTGTWQDDRTIHFADFHHMADVNPILQLPANATSSRQQPRPSQQQQHPREIQSVKEAASSADRIST